MKIKPGPVTVESIMTTPVYTVTPQTTVREAINLVLAKRISGAPVIDKKTNKVLSVISEADLIIFAAAKGMHSPLADFQDQMVPAHQLVTAHRHDTFEKVFKTFLRNPVRRVIVVDDMGSLQGLVSRSNLLRIFLDTDTVASKK